MAKLIYLTPASLDGYIADDGNFDWSAPGEEAFAFITDLHRPIGTYLYGRKEYETMAVWETPEVIPGRTPAMLDFARIWQAADKIVCSKSRETVSTAKTRLEREFHPQAVRELKAQSPLDISVAGPTLAAHAIRTGLVDEYHLLVVPCSAWRRHPGAAQQRTHEAGTAGRAPFCRWNGLSSLSRAGLMEAVTAGSEP
jgi:dihydrofolate reductase